MLQLERYRMAAARLRAMIEESAGLGDILELLEARLALAVKQASDEIAVFEAWFGELFDKLFGDG